MEALVTCIQQPPLRIKSLVSVNPKSKTVTWRINAKPRGFTGAPRNFPDRKISSNSPKEITIIGKSNDEDENEGDDKLPDVVIERMIVRILLNVGLPLATGIALLQAFSLIKEQNLWDVPRWLPFLTTLITFGASAVGIAFGTLSTSWDPEKKGSLLGFEEARQNWDEMWKQEDEFN